MAAGVYYVRTSGNNGHAGTSPSTAWATLAYALTTGAPAAGSIVYVGAGVYRNTIAVTVAGAATATGTNGATSNGGTTFTDTTASAFTSGMVGQNIEIVAGGSTYICTITAYTSTSVVTIAPATAVGFPVGVFSSCSWIVGKIAVIADVDGAQTGDAGQVTISGYTTNDKSAPTGSTLVAFGANGYLSLALFTIVNGTGGGITSTAGSTNLTFLDCVLNSFAYTGVPMTFVASAGTVAITIDRCSIHCRATYVVFTLPTTASGSADYDAQCVVRNSVLVMYGANSIGVLVNATGTATYKGGGVRLYNNTMVAGTPCFETQTASQLSTTVPCEIHNCVLVGGGVNAATSGQLTESYNQFYCSTARSNVSTGTGSNTTPDAYLVELGQSFKWGAGAVRQFLAPDGLTSPQLGFGADGSANDPVVDWQGRPRPSGGGSASHAVGYMELHDFAIQDTGVYPSGQTSSGKLTGPGDADLMVPLDAVGTTIAIDIYQGSGYTGTAYATATLLPEGELGIAAQVQTCSSSTGSWQTLTFSSVTASKAGWVRVRITSYDTSGTGTLNFGLLTAT